MGNLNEREVTRRYLDKAVDLLDEAFREASSYVSPEFLDRMTVAQGYLLEAGDSAVEGYARDCCGAVDQCGGDCVKEAMSKRNDKTMMDALPAHYDEQGIYICDCDYCREWRARDVELDMKKEPCQCKYDCCNKSCGDEEMGEAENSYHTKMLNRLYPIIETLIQMRGEVQSGVGFINQPINSNNKAYLNEAIGSLRDLELALRVEQAVDANA